MRFLFFVTVLVYTFSSCSSVKPQKTFASTPPPPAPDYSHSSNWAALPDRQDNADRVPDSSLQNRQQEAEVDVFFLYPTTYTGQRGEDSWNASLSDHRLNMRTDEGTILHQASIFNGAGRVYAPRYRQAHLFAYYSKDTTSAQAAFDLAYEDVKSAFTYYLENYNQGRPIIIASHSQGTDHAIQLLKDFFDGKNLKSRLVAAYLVGMPVRKNEFKSIPICKAPDDIQCFCSWRTFKRGFIPQKNTIGSSIGVTNPLLWTTDDTYADFSLNRGGVLRNFDGSFKKGLTDAQVNNGILWAAKPRFFGKIFITFKNYHIADYNLYYANVRQNARDRVKAFLATSKQ